MINNTNSSATTQSNSNCMNVPYRMLTWLFGKLVSIAKAGKRIFSDESLPDLTPIAERVFSKAKAQETFFNTPAPRETTSSREMELYNPANSPLPMIEGVELQCLSWEVRRIVGDMKQLLEAIEAQNLHEVKTGAIRGNHIETLNAQDNFDDKRFKDLAEELKVSPDIIDKCLEMHADEKIKWLDSINEEQITISVACCNMAGNALKNINYDLIPLIERFITTLSENYPRYSGKLASETHIREFQKGLRNLDKVLNKLPKGPAGDQIARDANLQTMFSNIKNKLQNLAQSLQIS